MTNKTHPVSVRLDPEIKAAIERAAEEDSRSVSAMIQKILADWILAQEKESRRKNGKTKS